MKIFDPKLTGSIEILNTISGNVTIAGGLNVEGTLGGAVTGSATASYIEYSNVANKPSLISSSAQLIGQTIDGDLNVGGILTAQEFHTEFVSASIIYESGSTQFGNTVDDVHRFTGSVQLFNTGSGAPALVIGETLNLSGRGGEYFGQIGWNRDVTNGDIFDSNYSAFQLHNYSGSLNLQVYNTLGNRITQHRFDGNKKVGINTDATRPLSVLHIIQTGDTYSDGIKLQGTSGQTYSTVVGSDNKLYLGYGTSPSGVPSDRVIIDTNGNVGIGTTVTGAFLSVKTSESAQGIDILGRSDEYSVLRFKSSNGSVTNSTIYNNGSDLIFENASSPAIVINSNGNVGIGTTTPAFPLHVVSTGIADVEIKGNPPEFNLYDSAGTVDQRRARLTIDDTQLRIESLNDADNTVPYRFMSFGLNDGYVGIGTTTLSTALTVAGDVTISGGSSTQLTVKGSEADIWLTSTGGGAGTWRILGSAGGSIKKFRIYDQNNNADRFNISSDGEVTQPSQPRFLARLSTGAGGYNATSTGDVVVPYNDTIVDIGSNFNTSTGKFTVPIDGTYIFFASAYANGGIGWSQGWLVVNGGRRVYTDSVFQSGANPVITTFSFIETLAANDTVGVHFYNNTDTSLSIFSNVYHTWFRGYLLG